MDSKNNTRRDSFEIDDGLDGADDFADESNPFENPFEDTIQNDAPPAYVEPQLESQPVGVEVPVDSQTASSGPQRNLGPGLINYYSQFFQLTTQDLKANLHESITFRKKPETEDEETRAAEMGPTDLYGTIWITATAATSKFFVLGFLYLVKEGIVEGSRLEDKQIDSLYLSLVHGIWLFYSYVFLTGFVGYKLLSKVDSKLTIAETLSILGYSLTPWIPVSILIALVELFEDDMVKIVSVPIKIFFVFCAFVKTTLYLHAKLSRKDGLKYTNAVIALNAIFCVMVKILLF